MDKNILNERLMGPDCTIIVRELLYGYNNDNKIRILDLGCGKGLTSIHLAEKYKNAIIFAADLWVEATDNYKFFKEQGYENRIIPLNTSAENLPFAYHYFDMIVSVDAYHYFGTDKLFFKEKIKPYLKDNGLIFIAVPGMKDDYEKVPQDLKGFISDEDFRFFKSIKYYENILKENIKEIKIEEMKCFNEAWDSWLATDNPYAVEDIELLKSDNGKFLNLIGIKGKI